MEQKQKLSIQTREEFKKENYTGWNFEEERKAINKGRLESEIKSLKREIERKEEELKKINPLTYKEYLKKNTYEEWVREVRRKNSDEWEIVENEDSKQVE